MSRDTRRYRRYLREERNRAALYRALATSARKPEERDVLLGLARAEERHADHWAEQLPAAERGLRADRRLGWRARALVLLARRRGLGAVLPLLERSERAEMRSYDDEEAAAEGMAVDERVHARALAGLAPAWRARVAHSVRAGVFGVNDGLVSNLALVMGVVGAQVESSMVLLTGLAGMLSGSLSMAAGEYISVTSQRELILGEVRLGAEHVAAARSRDAHELELLPEGEDVAAAGRYRDTEIAPAGAARRAALSNGSAFVAGAVVPVLPFVFLSPPAAPLTALVAAGSGLFVVGAVLSVVTGRPAWFSGLRQLLIGAGAAVATYLIGGLVGGLVG